MEKNNQIPKALPKGEYLIGLKELSDFLNVSTPTVKRLIDKGKVPFYKIGSRYFFEKSKIQLSITMEVSHA